MSAYPAPEGRPSGLVEPVDEPLGVWRNGDAACLEDGTPMRVEMFEPGEVRDLVLRTCAAHGLTIRADVEARTLIGGAA